MSELQSRFDDQLGEGTVDRSYLLRLQQSRVSPALQVGEEASELACALRVELCGTWRWGMVGVDRPVRSENWFWTMSPILSHWGAVAVTKGETAEEFAARYKAANVPKDGHFSIAPHCDVEELAWAMDIARGLLDQDAVRADRDAEDEAEEAQTMAG